MPPRWPLAHISPTLRGGAQPFAHTLGHGHIIEEDAVVKRRRVGPQLDTRRRLQRPIVHQGQTATRFGAVPEFLFPPVWHLRRTVDGGLFDTYTDSFNAVWQTARPVEG